MKQILFICLLCLSLPVAAVVEYHEFTEPEQQQAYSSLISELRCLVCQNQTIADSNADLAKDLRRQVHEMLSKGQSKQEIIDFMTQRYGEFVMYKPAFKLKTALLWTGPVIFLVTGFGVLYALSRRKNTAVDLNLSVTQQTRLKALLDEGEKD